MEAHFARGITLLQAALPLFVVLVLLLTLAARPLGWVEVAVVLGALAMVALAVSSAVLMGKRRRLAWSGAFATNVVALIAVVAGFSFAVIEGAKVSGTGADGGMVLVSAVVTFAFVGLPLIVLAMAALVLLLLPAVRRHYRRPVSGEALGSVTPSRLGSLT